jgi:hypothetical protein
MKLTDEASLMPASILWEEPGQPMALAGSATSRRLYLELASLATDELGCGTLTELDVRDTALSFRYHADPKPAVCIVAGPPRATAGGLMRKPSTLSSCDL